MRFSTEAILVLILSLSKDEDHARRQKNNPRAPSNTNLLPTTTSST
jgi:hypothetical protein